MKIAFIYDAVYPWVKGGAEKRVYEIAKHLIQSGHEVHWYCVGWWWTDNHHEDIISPWNSPARCLQTLTAIL